MSITKLTPSEFTISILDEKTNLSGFDCSDDDGLGLNEFIHEEALGYQKELMGVTHLFYYGDRIVGYVTVAMGSICVESTNLHVEPYGKVRYPALLLGRVAVDNDFRRRAIGRCIVKWSIGLAKKLTSELGCRFVVLATKNESRITFYTKCGFQVCPENRKKRKRKKKKALPKKGLPEENEQLKLMYFQLPV